MSLSPHFTRSAKVARELDRLVAASLIVAFGISDPAQAATLADCTEFELDTDAGLLRGTSYPCEYHSSDRLKNEYWSPAWVHFRFDDPAAAEAIVGDDRLNTYSGKWNFMFGGEKAFHTIDAERMVNEIKAVTPRNFRIVD